MAFMCLTFIISQMLARSADDLSSLSWATSLVGFSYGQFFGLAPIVMLYVQTRPAQVAAGTDEYVIRTVTGLV